jgi:hypothetical protein
MIKEADGMVHDLLTAVTGITKYRVFHSLPNPAFL